MTPFEWARAIAYALKQHLYPHDAKYGFGPINGNAVATFDISTTDGSTIRITVEAHRTEPSDSES